MLASHNIKSHHVATIARMAGIGKRGKKKAAECASAGCVFLGNRMRQTPLGTENDSDGHVVKCARAQQKKGIIQEKVSIASIGGVGRAGWKWTGSGARKLFY